MQNLFYSSSSLWPGYQSTWLLAFWLDSYIIVLEMMLPMCLTTLVCSIFASCSLCSLPFLQWYSHVSGRMILNTGLKKSTFMTKQHGWDKSFCWSTGNNQKFLYRWPINFPPSKDPKIHSCAHLSHYIHSGMQISQAYFHQTQAM